MKSPDHGTVQTAPFALFVPILARLAGLGTSFRMMRIPAPEPAGTGGGSILG